MPGFRVSTADVRAQSDLASQDDRPMAVADTPLVSVVLPCLDEEEAIGACIEKIQRTFAAANIQGEIVVCDNGSTDTSVAITERLGARVVHEPLRADGAGRSRSGGCLSTPRRTAGRRSTAG